MQEGREVTQINLPAIKPAIPAMFIISNLVPRAFVIPVQLDKDDEGSGNEHTAGAREI